MGKNTIILKDGDARIPILRGDGSVFNIWVNCDRMSATCPRWKKILEGAKKGPVEVLGVDFMEEEADIALDFMIEVVHGKNFLDRNLISPRSLYYMLEIHDWMGEPSFSFDRGEDPKNIALGKGKKHRFFPTGYICRQIENMIDEAGVLCLIQDWILLAVVADRLKLTGIMEKIKNDLSLFCDSDQTRVPKEIRDSLTDEQWIVVQRIGLVDEYVLSKRQSQIREIRTSIRLLVDQLEYHEAGILPNKETMEIYWQHHVAPCQECTSLELSQLIEGLAERSLLQVYVESYQDRVLDLIRALEDVDRATRHGMASECTQLTHLVRHWVKF
ncbi:hypothetical protein NM208_g15574 [Fusarium decemcellulare]|uniref:Uncharacterized protein n=1 Tax=Fusarium decemcellulare TaxID=57161 RepID=A0ACC1RF83_9HYPO|nr:hypothetical protein NM208_g15574 [Fusarium decemcellulare]